MNEPVHASLVVRGVSPDKVFAALLDVRSFPDWAFGLERVRVLGEATVALAPGTAVEVTFSAVGLTHRVFSTMTIVETPRVIEQLYTKVSVEIVA